MKDKETALAKYFKDYTDDDWQLFLSKMISFFSEMNCQLAEFRTLQTKEERQRFVDNLG